MGPSALLQDCFSWARPPVPLRIQEAQGYHGLSIICWVYKAFTVWPPPASVPALPFSHCRTPVTLLLIHISIKRSRRDCAGLGIRTVNKTPNSPCLHGADSLVGKAEFKQTLASQTQNVCAFASCPVFQAVRQTQPPSH